MTNTTKIIITDNYPTTITTDFLEFLHYIENNETKLTKTTQQITRKNLVAMYGLMSEPKLKVNEMSNQSDYPLLHLFFHLAMKLELIQKKVKGSVVVAVIQKENMTVFKNLTRSEQYVSLLNCFWLKVDWFEIKGSHYHQEPFNVPFLISYLEELQIQKELKLLEDRELNNLLYDYGYFLLYFSYFGFWHVELDEEQRKENRYRAKSVICMPLFKQLAAALLEGWEQKQQNDDGSLFNMVKLFGFDMMEDEKIEQNLTSDAMPQASFFDLLQPLFEEGELTKILHDIKKPIVVGEYLLKVALNNSCWRTIQLSEAHTLLDLHHLIQQAFDFDDDHLYAFYMNGKKFSKDYYNSPRDIEGPYVNNIKIGDLHLYEGQKFLYLFDFGTEWEFFITVLTVTEGKEGTQACIRQRKGESPDQYAW